MKAVRQVCTGLALATVMVGSSALALGITTSKHNFSAQGFTTGADNVRTAIAGTGEGTGKIKAASEDGICVFCHTPHKGQSSLLLWNHQLSTKDWTWSDVATSGGNKTTGGTTYPTLKGWTGSTVKCLSCHDGSVSVGAIYWNNAAGNTGRTGTGGLSIAMTAEGGETISDPIYRIAGGDGSDLSGNHPVGVPFPYGGVAAKYNGIEMGAAALASGWKQTPTGVKIFGKGGAGGPVAGTVGTGGAVTLGEAGIECASCHDPHGTANPYFLRVTKSGSQLCLSCHDK